MGRKRRERADSAELVLANAVDFLNAGLDILFSTKASSRDAKVGVTSIQNSDLFERAV